MLGARVARRTLLTLGAAAGVPVVIWRTLSEAVGASTGTVPTIPSNKIRESFGVNTHNQWQWTPYSYTTAMMDKTVALVKEVGASYFRERFAPGDPQLARQIPLLVAAGAKQYAPIGNWDSSTAQIRSDVQALVKKYPDPSAVFCAITGVNEPDSHTNWIPHTVELQKALYAEVRSTPALNGIPVMSPTVHGTNTTGIKSMADAGIANYCDQIAVHHYPGKTGPFTTDGWDQELAATKAGFPGKPLSVDEYGYASHSVYVNSTFQLPEDVAAVYAPRGVIECVRIGAKVSLYELLDQYDQKTQYNAHFGLVEATLSDPSGWRRKPIFYSLARLIALTRDDGPDFTPIPLQASISGTPRTMALSKRDGSHGVLHWREDRVYDHQFKKYLTVTPAASTVTLPAPRTVTITNVTTGKVTSLGSVTTYTVGVAGDALHARIEN